LLTGGLQIGERVALFVRSVVVPRASFVGLV